MSGAPDPDYILARRVLLDALDALGSHRDSVILIGAQAVYFHTGRAEIAVAEYTTDADLALDPRDLQPHPLLKEVLGAGGFRPGKNPGTWVGASGVEVDLLVPDSLGGEGRRGARLPHHGNQVARKARGIEGALVDHARRQIVSLDPAADGRAHEIRVAGPAALLVAKLHKIADRAGTPRRAEDKDALDVLRLLQAVATDDLATGMRRLLADKIAAEVTRSAIGHLETLFAGADELGANMAARAAQPLADADTIKASCAALASDLLATFAPTQP